MRAVKKIGMVLLAIYLIISGVMSIAGIVPSNGGAVALQVIAVAAGVLLLISICGCMSHCGSNKNH